MSIAALNFISNSLKAIGINYEFGAWTSEATYPYFVGEYQETPPLYENGMQETAFLLTGFSRGTWLELEETKEKIEKFFNKVGGKTVTAKHGSAVAVFYSNSLVVPTGDAELKKIQINLDVKEWSVS